MITNQYCLKHPTQKLTHLFSSSVCDLCDPPKGILDPTLSSSKVIKYCAAYGTEATCIFCGQLYKGFSVPCDIRNTDWSLLGWHGEEEPAVSSAPPKTLFKIPIWLAVAPGIDGETIKYTSSTISMTEDVKEIKSKEVCDILTKFVKLYPTQLGILFLLPFSMVQRS